MSARARITPGAVGLCLSALLALPACRDCAGGAGQGARTTRRVPAPRTPARPTPRLADATPRPAMAAPVVKPPKKVVPRRLHVRFFAAGHADGILLRTPGGHVVLVDAGLGNDQLLGDNLVQRRILPHLRKLGIRRLDAFIVTHPHLDHMGDPATLQAELGVNKILVNADGLHLLGSVLPPLMPGVTFQLLHRPHERRFGKLRLRVLYPAAKLKPAFEERSLWRQNNRSLVIMATYGKHRFLLTGDLAWSGERRLLATRQPVRADVLKLGHHGRKTTNAAWIRAVRPRYAVASTGGSWRRSRAGLPAGILRQLKRNRVPLLRTDRDGDIVFTTDGHTLRYRTYPEHAWPPPKTGRKTR